MKERTLAAQLTDEELAARLWWTNLSDRMRVALSYKHFNAVIVTGKQIGRASCRERVSSPV